MMGIIFCMPRARLMSATRITGCSVRSCTTCISYFERLDSSPVKSGWMVMALSLASFSPEGRATAITSPGQHI